MEKLNEFSARFLEDFQTYLQTSAKEQTVEPGTLREAMQYSLSSGGKRFRPLLLFAVVETCRGQLDDAYSAAAALEWIHTYSLVHDDLPAMDDDDFRRGKPTLHKQFGEAAAILAGDALLTAAFSMIADDERLSPSKRLKLVSELAKAAGPRGMVQGQMEDIEGESQKLDMEKLQAVHKKKTGALIEFAAFAGCCIADADTETSRLLCQYAEHIGLAFQIHNDLKDVVLNEEESGKTSGKDEILEKNTYPSLLGVEGAKKALEEQISQAIALVRELDEKSSDSALNKKTLPILIGLTGYLAI